jgi:sterol desaturase/sphingolipid hydroxylase (fatty acid hydroxylase superfamily)
VSWLAQNYHHLLFTDYGGIAFVFCLYLLLGAFEIGFPAEAGQEFSGRLTNVAVTATFLLGGGFLTKWALHTLALGPRHLRDRGILISIAILFGYGFVNDFIFYWYHRAQHRFDFFWPIHELHHTEMALNATSGLRTFWLEAPLQALLIALPASYIVGLDHRAILLLPLIYTGWLYFAHANWRLDLGFLTPVICGPQVHRIHHSNLTAHHNKNFAQYFPLIDMMFGTYYRPQRGEFPTTGLPERITPASLEEITVGPFLAWTTALDSRFSGVSQPAPKPSPPAPKAKRRQDSRKRRAAR